MTVIVDVIKTNFVSLLPVVKDAINNAEFVAIDTEFSGLVSAKDSRPSLFDDAEVTYRKARANVKVFSILQFGISTYQSVGASKYSVHTFNFNLFPAAVANYDSRFLVQASSAQFLSSYNFDFNKIFKEGIPFLNNEQEVLVSEYLKVRGSSAERPYAEKDLLRGYTSQVAKWLVQAREGDIYTYDKTRDVGSLPNDLIHARMFHCFPNVLPITSNDDVFVLEKVSEEKRKSVQVPCSQVECEKQMEELLGFTNVIRHLVDRKTILVGHNMFLDLLYIYDKFIDHLPESYTEYKKRMNALFPTIYDTKHMTHHARRILKESNLFESTALADLYIALRKPENVKRALFSPNVVSAGQAVEFIEGQGQVHEAGFDSFMCGYVFLSVTHLLTLQESISVMAITPIPFCDYGKTLQAYRNKVNVVRSTIPYMCMDGVDAPPQVRDRLYVCSQRWGTPLDVSQIATLLSSYGAVDIRSQSKASAIVAVSNVPCARRILEEFRGHKRYRIVKYSSWKHSKLAHSVSWIGAILAVTLCTVTAINHFKRKYS